MARVNKKKRIAYLHRAIANKKREAAKREELLALIHKWQGFKDLSDEEIGRRPGYFMSLISRIERLAIETESDFPEFREWIREIRAEFNNITQDYQQTNRAIRMAVNKQYQYSADRVVQSGTMCQVCTHRHAATQAYGVWLCKRCARGLGELPEGRS